ncbi:hypothetical protein Q5H91_06980 [Sphingomonas sp. KR1UV-12]|uniref:Uncharacterized protein n=1 Tax=Sphingomonas aurea TaxID=3063994 RepID=A0ABT9EJ23_9SPHN|nr:hypothetical protein [Sphingomonas sp. KR1UV-12]MDP1026949.1 hypothetical protein [Sphingomonas sp. KR1UV-12]
MTNPDAVARDMERIFGRAAAPRLATARRGSAPAWVAAAAALVATGVLVGTPAPRTAPPPPPAPRVIVPPPLPALVTAVSQPKPPQPTPAPPPPVGRRKPAPPPRIGAQEAPHLTGEALRRALAEDVVITRRLNEEALARQSADTAR